MRYLDTNIHTETNKTSQRWHDLNILSGDTQHDMPLVQYVECHPYKCFTSYNFTYIYFFFRGAGIAQWLRSWFKTQATTVGLKSLTAKLYNEINLSDSVYGYLKM